MDLKSISRLDKASGNFGRMPYRISNGEYLFEAFADTLKENVMAGKILSHSMHFLKYGINRSATVLRVRSHNPKQW